MARLWTSGFELQTVTAGREWQATNGSPTINTTTKRLGAASLRCNPTAAVSSVAIQIYTAAQTSGHVFLRMYLYIATLPSSSTQIMGWANSNSTTTGIYGVRLNTDGTLQVGSDSSSGGSSSSALSTGQWYRIEVDYDDAADTVVGYLDGVNFSGTVGSMNLGGGRFARWGFLQSTTGDIYIDDVAMNDTSGSTQTGLPGGGYVVHLKPNAAGDNAGFGTVVGGTNNWDRVSETTPDDSTTYNSTTTSGTTNIDDFNIASASSGGIDSTDSITFVAVGARVGSNNTTTANLIYRIKSQASGTVTEGNSVSCALNGWTTHDNVLWTYQLTSFTDPQAGGAWTPALLDTAQIGYRTNVSQTTSRRVTTLWALVEFNKNFTQAPADSVGVTDTAAIGRDVTSADSVGVTDTASLGVGVGAADTVGLTDTVVTFKGVDQTSDDSVGVTDSIATVQEHQPSVSDTAGVTDTVATVYTGIRSFEDAEGVTDDAVVSLGHLRTVDDTENVTDTTAVVQGHGQLPADTENLTDTVSIVYDGIRTPEDSAGVTDSLANSHGNVKADNVGITDSVVIDETSLPVVPPSTRPMIGLTIKLFDPAPSALSDMAPFGAGGDVVSICPDLKAVSWTDELSQSGTVSIEYPADGVNYALLTADRAEGAVFWGEMEIPGTRFLVAEQARDPLDEQGSTVKINAPAFVGKRLEEAIVHPLRWPTPTPPQQTFTNVTAGSMLLTLIAQAQTRDALGNLETDFTGLVDSDGAAWAQTVSMTIDVGDTYRSVVNKLVEMGVIDWRGDGRTLQVYNWGTLGSDLSGGSTPVVLYAGRDMLDAPENRSVLGLTNAVYSLGEDAWSAQVTDATSIAEFGRIEGFISTSGVVSTGTLTVIGQAYLDKMKNAQQEFTHSLTFADATAPVPYTDYRVGDRILRVVNGESEAMTVRQMTFSMDDTGDVKATVTLNDKLYTQDVLLQRRINALTGGSGSTSSSPADPTSDKVASEPPTAVNVTSDAYVGNGGVTYAAVEATWTEPTENTDESTFTDLDYYEVQWKYDTDTNFAAAGVTGVNVLQWSGVLPGRNIDVRVRAVDQNGNKSAWSATGTHLTASDTTAPAQPSTPVVSNYLGVLRVSWDGLTNGGGAQPSDFAGAEVHISVTNGFTPSSATKVDTLPAAGVSVISALPGGTALTYGTTYYVKLISLDRSGNASTPSSQGSGSPQQVVQTDIGTGQVGLSNLSFSDVGNLVDDGSFELSNWRTSRTTTLPTGWAFATDFANNGTYSLKIQNTVGGTVDWTMRSGINVQEGETYLGVFDYRMTGTTALGTVTLMGVYKNAAGSTVSTVTLTTASLVDSTWHARTAGSESVVPATASSMDILIRVNSITAGSVWIDAVEVRQRVDTLLLANLAVTNAKIADLAVNNAKISDLSVAKVTAGTIAADWIVGARIKTADTGARVELNSTGLKAYNSGGTNTVNFSSSDGAAYILGQLVSGTSGRRVEVNPTATYLPEIRFYPNTGSEFGFINGVSAGTDVNLGMNSSAYSDAGVDVISRCYLTTLQAQLAVVREDTQERHGGYVFAQPGSLYAGYIRGGVDGGTFYADDGKASIGFDDGTSTTMNVIELVENRTRHIGRWSDYVTPDEAEGIFTGSVAGGSGGTSLSLGYGVTMDTQLLPIVAIRDAPTVANTRGFVVSAASDTGFSVQLSGAADGAWSIYFWCYRI